jgi:hypothetical protein
VIAFALSALLPRPQGKRIVSPRYKPIGEANCRSVLCALLQFFALFLSFSQSAKTTTQGSQEGGSKKDESKPT